MCVYRLLYQIGDLDAAIFYFDEAIKEDPSFSVAYLNRSSLRTKSM
jgi:hypothetical protein